MLESGLFFTLGFLTAALVVMLIAPAIWRRAVALTKQRMESAVPLTLNEVQAEKDQLRAEFAMANRRLEVSLEKQNETVAEQSIEINRRRDQMLKLEEKQADQLKQITDLDTKLRDTRTELSETEEKFATTTLQLANVETRLEEKSGALESMEAKYRSVVDDFDDQKIEIVARETKIDTIQDEARRAKESVKSKSEEQKRLASELKALTAALAKEEKRTEQFEEKMVRMTAEFSDMENRLERRDADIARLRGKSGTSKSNKTSTDIAEADGQYMEENEELRTRLRKAEGERETLKIELSALQMSTGDNWDEKGLEGEKQENALVREKIADLAAQVTAMTASIEGSDSPINAALAKAPKKRKSKKGETTDGVNSLADRIRALQAVSEKA